VWKQISWFCLMLCVPLAAALCCFLDYSESRAAKIAPRNATDILVTDPKSRAWKSDSEACLPPDVRRLPV